MAVLRRREPTGLDLLRDRRLGITWPSVAAHSKAVQAFADEAGLRVQVIHGQLGPAPAEWREAAREEIWQRRAERIDFPGGGPAFRAWSERKA